MKDRKERRKKGIEGGRMKRMKIMEQRTRVKEWGDKKEKRMNGR